MDKVLKVILIGAGNRGETYTDIMAQMSDKFKVIAVAEPIESRRNNIQKKHPIICALKIGSHYLILERSRMLLLFQRWTNNIWNRH